MRILKNISMILWLAFMSAMVLSCDKDPKGGGSSITGETAVNGTIKYSDGKPAEGVMVTDGYTVTRTDANGKYSFDRHASAIYVYYSIPADAKVETAANGLPCFYKKLLRNETRYDFSLTRQAVEKQFRLFALGDPQVKDAAQIRRFSGETVADIKAYAAADELPDYAITLGDIVGNKWDLYPDMVKAMDISKAGIPIFQTIGNHDHEFPKTNDLQARRRYENAFGPSYYSFDRGDVLHGAQESTDYNGGLDDAHWNWLQKDLKYVSREKMVVICMHIPPKAGAAYVAEGHCSDMLNLLAEFKNACIVAGHTHNNVTNWNSTVNGKNIHEYVTGTTCGAWWHGTICTDGTPCGYGVFRFDGPELVNHIYKATKYDDGFQFRLYRSSDFPSFKWNDGSKETTIKFPVNGADKIMVNAWNATSAWKWEVWEDGVKTSATLTNTAISTKYYDVWAKNYFYYVEKLTSSSYNGSYNHMLYFSLQNKDAAVITLKATDQWGNKFESSRLTTNLPIDYPGGY